MAGRSSGGPSPLTVVIGLGACAWAYWFLVDPTFFGLAHRGVVATAQTGGGELPTRSVGEAVGDAADAIRRSIAN